MLVIFFEEASSQEKRLTLTERENPWRFKNEHDDVDDDDDDEFCIL